MDPTALLALWLAVSTAFSSGAEHLKQREYAQAVDQFNLVIAADAEADGLAGPARLLRGHALCALDQREGGLIDLMARLYDGDDTTRADAERLLTKYRFTERQRMPPHLVIKAFEKACADGDQASALTWCTDEGKANLETIWERPNFVKGIAINVSRTLYPHYSDVANPYASAIDLYGVTGITITLGFDDGWWVTGIVESEQSASRTLHTMLAPSEALVEYARAHDGDFPPAMTREHLPALDEKQIIFNYYERGRQTKPYQYFPPPRRLTADERRTYILLADPLPTKGLHAAAYADGHITLHPPADLNLRLTTQSATYPATPPAPATEE